MLATADVLLLGEVYPAGEPPIVAADGRALARALARRRPDRAGVRRRHRRHGGGDTRRRCGRRRRADHGRGLDRRRRSSTGACMMMIEPLRFTGLRGELRRNESLAKHTSWRCGGAADVAFVPADRDDLATFVRQLPDDEPVTVIGLGSNLLVRDGGVRGTVVLLHAALNEIGFDGSRIRAEAGVASPKVSRFAALHDRADAEFLSGIPGTIGGALAMNAGCYGGETWRDVAEVEVLTRQGAFERRPPEAYVIGYRSVVSRRGADDIAFTAAWFDFPPGNGAYARGRIKALLTQAHRDPAARPAERGIGIPQSGRRSRCAPDRELRTQGLCDRRRARVGKARQFHRQCGRARDRGRRRGADRARPRRRPATRPVSIWSRKSASSGRPDERVRQGRGVDGRPERRSARSRCCPATRFSPRSRAAASTRTRSIRPSARSSSSSATDSSACSSRCTAASAKTAPCRARSKCWAFRTPAAA